MPPPAERQTLIALKARRTASRVAKDILHRGKLKPADIACVRCGQALEEWLRDGTPRLCPRCTEWERRSIAWSEAPFWQQSFERIYFFIYTKAPPFRAAVQFAWLAAALIASVAVVIWALR